MYNDYRKNLETLGMLPLGTTICFFQRGKERYLRKISPTKLYPHPWYSLEQDASIPNERVPYNWRVLVLGKNPQKKSKMNRNFMQNTGIDSPLTYD